jgi:hypothetical protein
VRRDRDTIVEVAFGRLLDESDAERARAGRPLQPARHAEVAAHVAVAREQHHAVAARGLLDHDLRHPDVARDLCTHQPSAIDAGS